MNNELSLIKTFVEIDDKCKQKEAKRKRGRIRGLFDSELMTIFLIYKQLGYKTLREYFDREVHFLRKYFPQMPNYKGLMKLKDQANGLLINELNSIIVPIKESSERFYIDSTPLPVCKMIRSNNHTTFRSLSSYGYSSTGIFYGLKLHLVIDEKKKLANFDISTGKTHDISFLQPLTIGLTGQVAGDKGYISTQQKESLESRRLTLLTKQRKNMTKLPVNEKDKLFLRKRPKIETVFGKFKRFLSNGLSLARSIPGAFFEILSSLAATSLPRPSII